MEHTDKYASAAAMLAELQTEEAAVRTAVLAGNMQAANAAAKRMADKLNKLTDYETALLETLCNRMAVPSKSAARPYRGAK